MKPFKPSSEQIRFAVEALTEVGIVDSDGTYAKEFKSSFSSFGATVSQCGFAIALTVFENPDSRSKVRKGVPIVIKHYLIRAFGQKYVGLRSLSEWYADPQTQILLFEEDVINAATVLKIALRLFAPKKNKEWQPLVQYENIVEISIPQVSSRNLGYVFNHVKGLPSCCDELLCSMQNGISENVMDVEHLIDGGFDSIRMRITAPGLIIGMGLSHGTSDNEAVKTGLQFDYTSGLPVIPGSSVKGVIRSAFPNDNDDESRMRYIFDILKGLSVISDHDALLENYKGFILRLRDNMFGLADKKGMDVFADALVVGHGGLSNVIAEDYLTPHTGGLLDPPIPIRIVKVCTGVIFSFCYKFSSFQEDGMRITADKKKNICTSILEDFGIGAKTNVGYGCLKRL